MFEIEYVEGTVDDLAKLQARERKLILDNAEKQLRQEPARRTRNRKPLLGLIPPWEHVEPVWELRIGEYRVFYDVDEAASIVTVRAIRHKGPHRSTEDIL